MVIFSSATLDHENCFKPGHLMQGSVVPTLPKIDAACSTHSLNKTLNRHVVCHRSSSYAQTALFSPCVLWRHFLLPLQALLWSSCCRLSPTCQMLLSPLLMPGWIRSTACCLQLQFTDKCRTVYCLIYVAEDTVYTEDDAWAYFLKDLHVPHQSCGALA